MLLYNYVCIYCYSTIRTALQYCATVLVNGYINRRVSSFPVDTVTPVQKASATHYGTLLAVFWSDSVQEAVMRELQGPVAPGQDIATGAKSPVSIHPEWHRCGIAQLQAVYFRVYTRSMAPRQG